MTPTLSPSKPLSKIEKCQSFHCPLISNCKRYTRKAASIGQQYHEYWRKRTAGEPCPGYAPVIIGKLMRTTDAEARNRLV